MTFHIGQKVVCVDDSRRVSVQRVRRWRLRQSPWRKLDHNLNRGDIYTVTASRIVHDVEGNGFQMIHVGEARHFEVDIGFPHIQFRALVARKTSIDIFRRMLTPSELEKAKRDLVDVD